MDRLDKDVAACVIDWHLHSTDTPKGNVARDESVALDVFNCAQMEKYGTAVWPIAHLTKNKTSTATTETRGERGCQVFHTKQTIANWFAGAHNWQYQLQCRGSAPSNVENFYECVLN